MINDLCIQRLRKSIDLAPVELAKQLNGDTMPSLTQWSLIFYFKHAFPCIPLNVLTAAGSWNEVSSGGLDDEDFNSLLAPWLEKAKKVIDKHDNIQPY